MGKAKLERTGVPDRDRLNERVQRAGRRDTSGKPEAAPTGEPQTERPDYANSRAAQMLARGFSVLALEKKISLREVGRRLGYRQPVVLSHMANGRVPVPIDRALDIAREMELPERTFLLACLEQRHPEIDWGLLTGDEDSFAKELAKVAGKPLDDLPLEHQIVMREVARDPRPRDRWLKTAELPTVDLIRELRPNFTGEGLNEADRRSIRKALART